ncbi:MULTISPECIES: hypothetical protein [unclassified Beijerinckia]|uniref:DUF4170 domain-containing protein n=1 Tax=unclassified Beijerinckia TaxID=2638183 RepID=UPI00089B8B4F|nr:MULTISPECIES: hypothetical protein [unclassified Beijerinckia]MDH7795362.1 hypothetical protein [Beijerinckia sp. GAS462]SEB98316.1 hypothetical protein SAMN05443249_1635 [Beijerinckia sp. 28-YEA-48]
MQEQFWVVGGEFSDLDFRQIIEGTGKTFGPFENYEAAQKVWRDCSLANRFEACARFSIVTSAIPAQRRQAA